MKFKTQEVVRGATRFAGDIDGEAIKSGYVFVDVSLDAEGKGWGYRSEAMKVKDLEVIDRIKDRPFPFLAELEVEQVATRNKSQLIVVNVKPLPQPAPTGQPVPAGR